MLTLKNHQSRLYYQIIDMSHDIKIDHDKLMHYT
jgi:hypothetical protein